MLSPLTKTAAIALSPLRVTAGLALALPRVLADLPVITSELRLMLVHLRTLTDSDGELTSVLREGARLAAARADEAARARPRRSP